MAWIEVHQALPTHRKVLDLAEVLNIKPVIALGHLVSFWLWALDNAPDGNLTTISKKTITIAAQFSKTPEKFFQAMSSAGWFDNTDGVITIHDWQEYAGRLVQKRADNKERMRLARSAHMQSTNHERAVLPYPTVPNSTIYIETLRGIPGWTEKGLPYEKSLLLWVKRKSFSSDDLERAAIGLAKVQEKTLKGYSNLARAFQDRLNKGYDRIGGDSAIAQRNPQPYEKRPLKVYHGKFDAQGEPILGH